MISSAAGGCQRSESSGVDSIPSTGVILPPAKPVAIEPGGSFLVE